MRPREAACRGRARDPAGRDAPAVVLPPSTGILRLPLTQRDAENFSPPWIPFPWHSLLSSTRTNPNNAQPHFTSSPRIPPHFEMRKSDESELVSSGFPPKGFPRGGGASAGGANAELCDVAAAGRLANQDRKQTNARKPSSGEVAAARQTGAGKTSTAAPQNGQNELHYHRKGASAICGSHDGAGGLGFQAKGKLKTEIPV